MRFKGLQSPPKCGEMAPNSCVCIFVCALVGKLEVRAFSHLWLENAVLNSVFSCNIFSTETLHRVLRERREGKMVVMDGL
jgi:hypothetical protein